MSSRADGMGVVSQYRWVLLVAALCLADIAAAEEPVGSGEPGREGATPSATPRTPTARVTAVRMADLPDDPSSFATVIQVDEYDGEAKTVADVLAQQVGVQVRQFGGPGQFSELSIRGSTGAQVVVLLDGVRLNSAQNGSVDLSTLPLDLLERIEISRGGGSVQAGSNAVGGVVRLISRKAGAKRHLSASAGGSSFDTQRGSFLYTGPAVGDRDIVLGYNGFHTKGDWDFQSVETRADGSSLKSQEFERINNESQNHTGLLRLGRDFDGGSRLEFTDQLYYGSRGLPGLDTGAPDDGGQNAHAHERKVRNVSALRAATDEIGIWGHPSLEARASHRWERTHFTNPDPDFGSPSDIVQRENTSELSSDLVFERELANMLHSVTLSVNGRRDALEDDDFGDPERLAFGAFLQDEVGFWDDRVVFAPAVRFDATEGFDDEWIPRAGLVVTPWKWIRLKANAERAYRVPSFGELYFPDSGGLRGNPNLDPEESWNFDAGVEFAIEELGPLRSIRIEVAVFHNEIENSIVFQKVSVETVQATNTGDVEIDGLELAGGFNVLGWLDASANWTHLDADLKRSGGGFLIRQSEGALPGRPDDEVSVRIQLGPPSGVVSLVGEMQYTSKFATSFSGNSFVDSRTVYDASASIDVAHLGWIGAWPGRPTSLRFSINVTNIGDESVRDALGFPQPGRSLGGQVEARW